MNELKITRNNNRSSFDDFHWICKAAYRPGVSLKESYTKNRIRFNQDFAIASDGHSICSIESYFDLHDDNGFIISDGDYHIVKLTKTYVDVEELTESKLDRLAKSQFYNSQEFPVESVLLFPKLDLYSDDSLYCSMQLTRIIKALPPKHYLNFDIFKRLVGEIWRVTQFSNENVKNAIQPITTWLQFKSDKKQISTTLIRMMEDV